MHNGRQTEHPFSAIKTTFGGLDILVTNAGICELAPLVTQGEHGNRARPLS